MNNPDRIPIAERLQKLNQQSGVAQETQVTSTDALSTQATSNLMINANARTHALTVTSEGGLDIVQNRASVGVAVIPFEEAKPLDPQVVHDHHLLVTGPDVDPRELEALAVSIWDDAGWIQPGLLRLTDGATLSGPWRINKEIRMTIGTPARMEQAWILDVPATRAAAPAPLLTRSDPLARAFADGMPAGKEFEVLQALTRVSRRLAGALRAAPSGNIIEPDADGAVAMTVYAARWVDEEDLAELLRPYLPDIVNSQDADKLAPIDSPERAQTREEIAKRVNIPEDELVRIAEITQAADRKAAEEGFVVRGYSLLASAGNTSRVHITVTPADYTPSVLRFEQWPQGSAIEYGVHWVMPHVYRNKLGHPSRALRFERNRVKDQIELIASLIARSTGGHMLDEDQFLVAEA
ncbi:MAG: hypothetical protein Q4E01_06365 [Actinomycetaceae bacterium]|nr:hypothetical protein [Actinomycetaceae bacterium]